MSARKQRTVSDGRGSNSSSAYQILRQGRSHVGAIIAKGDRDFATAVDVQVEETIKTALHELTPDVPFLGEEHVGAALGTGPMWVLDPIDGTVNFSRGSPLCGISLALIQDGRPRLAVVDSRSSSNAT